VEEKLKKVRNLLAQDKTHLSRLRQKQTTKEKEVKNLRATIDSLRNDLKAQER